MADLEKPTASDYDYGEWRWTVTTNGWGIVTDIPDDVDPNVYLPKVGDTVTVRNRNGKATKHVVTGVHGPYYPSEEPGGFITCDVRIPSRKRR